MNSHPIIECEQMISQLENIIRAASMYGSDTSYYEKHLSMWEKKHEQLCEYSRLTKHM